MFWAASVILADKQIQTHSFILGTQWPADTEWIIAGVKGYYDGFYKAFYKTNMPESRKQLSAQEIAGASVNSTEAASASSIVTTSSIVEQKRSSSIAAQKVASSIAAADSIVATNSIAAHKADTK